MATTGLPGLVVTLLIMAADIAINATAFGRLGMTWEANSFLFCQIGYGLFAFASAPLLWPHIALR